MNRFQIGMTIVLVSALSPVGAYAAQVFIETVPVGDVGNADDIHGTGYGGVNYSYKMGKYEVTAGQYTAFLNAVGSTDTYGLYNSSMWTLDYGCKIQRSGTPSNYTYSVAADRANRPVNYVSWGDAARFANWLHNGRPNGAQDLNTTEDGAYFLNGVTTNENLMAVRREADWKWAIPTEDEWYKAAYYNADTNSYYNFPTSSDTAPGYVNDAGVLSGTGAPFVEGGTDPGNYATYDGDEGTDGIGSPYWATEVGEWENSASPYGTYDQGGNVWERNESVSAFNSSLGMRGGPHQLGATHLHASHRGGGAAPLSEGPGLGFRVASVPEPGSITLLLLGLTGVLLWWRCRR